MRNSILLAMLLLLGVGEALAEDQVRAERRTLIGAELLGRGLFVTFNVEHFFTPSFGLGAGLLAAGSGDGGFAVLPLYASFVPGNVHSVYFGAGVTFLQGTDFDDFDSTAIFTTSVGYQYHSWSGLYVRPLFTLLYSEEADSGAFLWPGLSIGGSF